MMSSNLSESEHFLKKSPKTCRIISTRGSSACVNCRYMHKGICNEFFENKSENITNDNIMNQEEKIKTVKDLRLEDSEPVLNLKDLFYDIKIVNDTFNQRVEEIPNKAKYDNFKLLSDISKVLLKCRHLTQKDKLLYCQSQRYFMKLYLREINKP